MLMFFCQLFRGRYKGQGEAVQTHIKVGQLNRIHQAHNTKPKDQDRGKRVERKEPAQK